MRELRLVLLGLAAIIALSLGATFLLRAFKIAEPATRTGTASVSPPPPLAAGVEDSATKAARANIERAIADSPDYTRFFDRLRLVFPSDYEAIMSRLAKVDAATKEINVDKVMLDAVADLRHAHGPQLANASDDALTQYFVLETKEVQELGRRDPHLCVVFASGGQAPGFLNFWADHRPLVVEAAIAGLDAMNSGRMDQVKRAIPSDGDLQVLDHALVDAGLTRPEISALLDDTPVNPPIADDRMCKAQQTYMTIVASLEPDVRLRLYALWAQLMAKS